VKILGKNETARLIISKVRVGVLVLSSVVLVLIFSKYYVDNVDFSKGIGGSNERMSTLSDASNFNRFNANLEFIQKLTEGRMIVVGNGTGMDGITDLRPHNAFFRAVYRFGLVLALIGLMFYLFVANIAYSSAPEFVIALFAYYCFLNDFITGNELVLFTILALVIKQKKEWRKNEVTD